MAETVHADDHEARLAAGEVAPDEFVPFDRTKTEACAEEGHLLHDDGNEMICLRCPHTEPRSEG